MLDPITYRRAPRESRSPEKRWETVEGKTESRAKKVLARLSNSPRLSCMHIISSNSLNPMRRAGPVTLLYRFAAFFEQSGRIRLITHAERRLSGTWSGQGHGNGLLQSASSGITKDDSTLRREGLQEGGGNVPSRQTPTECIECGVVINIPYLGSSLRPSRKESSVGLVTLQRLAAALSGLKYSNLQLQYANY